MWGTYFAWLHVRTLPVEQVVVKITVPGTELELFQIEIILHLIKCVEHVHTRLEKNELFSRSVLPQAYILGNDKSIGHELH